LPFASCHASTVVELANGDLMAAWFGGSAEGNPDVAIWGCHRRAGVWSPTVELAREPGVACYNPVLFHTANGHLWLYYKFGRHPECWTAGRTWSTDGGTTWSRVEHLPAGLYGPVRTKPLVFQDGRTVSGTSVETWRSWACWIEWSSDHGTTWYKSGPITIDPRSVRSGVIGDAPPAVPGSAEWVHTEGIIQPAVISLGGSHLRFYARSTAKTGKICIADSTDSGVTWTQARPIDLPNPNSGIDAVTLHDGRVVLAYNHSDSRRTPLNLAVSRDGENFAPFYVLENAPGEYSYPAIIQARDGDLLITYTHNRSRMQFVQFPYSEIPH